LNYDEKVRQFFQVDFDRFGLIIPVDLDIRADLFKLTRNQQDKRKIVTMRTFDTQGGPSGSVQDLYYSGVEGFNNVYKVVKISCQELLYTPETGEVESYHPVAGRCITNDIFLLPQSVECFFLKTKNLTLEDMFTGEVESLKTLSAAGKPSVLKSHLRVSDFLSMGDLSPTAKPSGYWEDSRGKMVNLHNRK
jgi:hypothetical protein